MTEQEEIAMLKKQIEELQDTIKGLHEVIDSRAIVLPYQPLEYGIVKLYPDCNPYLNNNFS